MVVTGAAGSGRLLPCLTKAGFIDLITVWEPGGNGEELLVEGRCPHH